MITWSRLVAIDLSAESRTDAYKVEPARRAYEELGAKAIITGRRASQGADRASLQPLEVDSTGLLKLNPLFAWNFALVEWYIKENGVPTNALLAQGYKSIGDWHSTAKAGEGAEGERAGRWAGKEKTECGLHVDYFKLKAAALAQVSSFVVVMMPPALIVFSTRRRKRRR
jgi:phosphoadenosine phosphosulfate reductase